VVRTVRVRQEVSEWLHLTDNWAILEDLSHDVLSLVSNAEIVHSVKLGLDTANVGFKVINFALSLLSVVRHAFVQDKSFGLSPFQNLVDIPSVAPERVHITINDFLG
jgi:hypothetical protein